MAMNAQQSSGLSAKVRDMWERNQDLLKNAGSLAATRNGSTGAAAGDPSTSH